MNRPGGFEHGSESGAESGVSTPARVALIALDLDGTLLRSDGSISQRTRDALAAAEATGIVVMSVTARPPRRVRLIAESTGLSGLAICSNGGVLYDIATDTAVEQVVMDEEVAATFVTNLRRELPEVRFAVEAGMRYGCEPSYAIVSEHLHDLNDSSMVRDDALALCALGVTKLIVQHPDEPLETLLEASHRHAGTLATVTHSGSNFVEVAAAGVTKALALEVFCRERGIDAGQVIAFGDMPNDLPMLEWAGHSVAVANAHVDLLAAADEVTASNDDDGVAIVLERLAAQDYLISGTHPHVI